MDRATLITAMGNSVISDEECAAFNEALLRSGCTTVNRAAMFCAQIGHESVGLRYYEEIASGSAYEWRSDLGNNQPGDGVRFKGRGPIQVTGRANYTTLSAWAYEHGYVPTRTYFVDNPTQLGTIRYGFLGAVWYWTVARNMNSYADRGDIYGATVAVNGGTNGLQDRTNRWNLCLTLGQALLPTQPEEIDMAAKDDIIGFIKTYVGPLISDVKDIRQQLTGGRDSGQYPGWKQLGQNDKGQNFTIVDSLADARQRIISLEADIKALKEGK